jgi:hypothetical protein
MKNKNYILRENQSHPEGRRIRKMENSKKEIFCSLDMIRSLIWTVQQLGFEGEGGAGLWQQCLVLFEISAVSAD